MKGSEEPRLRFERILVTGGLGFIGSHLVSALASLGCSVTILDNLSLGTLKNMGPHLSNGEVKLVRNDVRNAREVKTALSEVEAVFHLAAITSVPYSIENPIITGEVNAEGTRNLLEASADSDVKHVVFVSSCAVYGEPQYLPIDENHPLNPMSPYAESKVKGEEYCKEFQEKYGLKTLILRMFNVYGPNQSTNQYSGVITKFINDIKEGKPPTIYGDGYQTRDFVHVSDAVQALLLSMSNDRGVGETFNIGSGKSVTINELCRLTLRKLQAEMKPVYMEPRRGDVKHSCARIEKARKTLSYRPKVSLQRGLADLVGQWTRRLE